MSRSTTSRPPPAAHGSPGRRARELGWLAALAVFQVAGTRGAAIDPDGRLVPDLIAYLLLLAGPALLVFRRRWPVPVLVAVLAVTVAYYAAGYVYGPAFLSALVALISAVLAGYRIVAWLLGALALAAFFVTDAVVSGNRPAPASIAGHVAWLLLVLAVAEIIRVRRSRLAESRKAQAEADRRRLSEERLRIARDLHDSLGHSMSLINVQAGVALHLMDREPERARTALIAIKETSRSTLHEVKEVLEVLRGANEAAPREPAPGLARLEDLRKQFAAAGLEVRVTAQGEQRPLPPAVDLTAYRIVQEALTNVLRHSGARTASVLLAFGPDVLTVSITDDGHGGSAGSTAPGEGGTGIRGMRDRAASVGGGVSAGPLSGGGFRVAATLPFADGTGGESRDGADLVAGGVPRAGGDPGASDAPQPGGVPSAGGDRSAASPAHGQETPDVGTPASALEDRAGPS